MTANRACVGDAALWNVYKFTGKERDSESGLDNFDARYYGSSLGRFMSPDPMGGHLADPQTLNRYAYVRNNPLSLTDPTGLDFYLTCTSTNENTSTCQGGHQGTTTTDANGKSTFTPTVIQSDKDGNLTDQNGNSYTGTFDGKTVTFTDGNGSSSTGQWRQEQKAGEPALQSETTGITGGGALSDNFHFTFYNHGPGQQLNASFFYSGASLENEIRELGGAGYHFSMADQIFNLRETFRNPGALNFRTSGDPGSGANSGHLLLKLGPRATVPYGQPGEVHTGETNPTVSGRSFLKHIGSEQ